ncbi:hypothetical protein HZH66_004615 [Vespula vulgaris]|uniref:Uncharacterized protein n=1 Tax=Vespula vulgaris TaxID=7454 RepID=A0A834NCF8_VESVU|nr:hypothetical protein HZH66_004615 [Vespula vulgaris]
MAIQSGKGALGECVRAAQKLNLSSSPHRRRRSGDENIGPEEQPIFPNGYAALLLKSPPPAPPALLRRIGVKELTGVGKVTEKSDVRDVCGQSMGTIGGPRVVPRGIHRIIGGHCGFRELSSTPTWNVRPNVASSSRNA